MKTATAIMRRDMDSTPMPTLTPHQARRRASAVVVAVGLAQLTGAAVMFTQRDPAAQFGLLDWPVTTGAAGLIYLILAWPIRVNFKPAVWAGMVAALAQAMVLVGLAVMTVGHAWRLGEPGAMSMGVLFFGTLACVHLFVLRWLWEGKTA